MAWLKCHPTCAYVSAHVYPSASISVGDCVWIYCMFACTVNLLHCNWRTFVYKHPQRGVVAMVILMYGPVGHPVCWWIICSDLMDMNHVLIMCIKHVFRIIFTLDYDTIPLMKKSNLDKHNYDLINISRDIRVNLLA